MIHANELWRNGLTIFVAMAAALCAGQLCQIAARASVAMRPIGPQCQHRV